MDSTTLTKQHKQIRQDDGSPAIHLRMIRSPACVQDLIEFLNTHHYTLVWIERNACIANGIGSRKLPKHCLSLWINDHHFSLHGQSDQDVGKLAAFLWTLPDRNCESSSSTLRIQATATTELTVGNALLLLLFTTEQMNALLMKKRNSSRKIEFRGMTFSEEQSVILASQPHQVHLLLDNCIFMDGGRAFVDTLEKRETSFGNLMLQRMISFHQEPPRQFNQDIQRRLFQVTALEHLRIHNCDLKPGNNDLLPFASNAEWVEYNMAVPRNEWVSLKSITIVPKRFVLIMNKDLFGFSSVFLQATSNLTEMGLVIEIKPTKQTLDDLLVAVDRNQNLKELEIGCIDRHWLPRWKDLMCIIGRHQGLCKLKLHSKQSDPTKREVARFINGLSSMLQQNHNIVNVEFIGRYEEGHQPTLPLEELLRFNRFFQGSKALARENELVRMSLLGRAMIDAHDVTWKTAVLLSEHVDALCMLLRQTGSASSMVDSSSDIIDTPTVESESVAEEDQEMKKRKRKECHSHEFDVSMDTKQDEENH